MGGSLVVTVRGAWQEVFACGGCRLRQMEVIGKEADECNDLIRDTFKR